MTRSQKIAILTFWTCIHPLFGADGRPRIGLVLEGGGALGFAHIGVIQYLEENHVPVHAVTGTSMGGLIGGLYAAGKSPAEIQALVKSIDWDSVLVGQSAFSDLSFRRKEDRVAYPSRLEFGLKEGFSLPPGLNSGQAVDAIIDRSLLPYYGLGSFDQLPIPFRCVATDLVTGKEKVFERGSLPLALRSTMSIPAVFSPAVDGDSVYTDGGSLNNLPVDIAKRMGVDIVIAVYLDTGPPAKGSYSSLLGVAGRIVSIMISANEMHSIELADILLSADLKTFSPDDFSKSEQIIPKGYEAAQRKKALLAGLALGSADWAEYVNGRSARLKTTTPAPQFIQVTGANPGASRAIEKSLHEFVGSVVDPNKIDEALNVLVGRGAFESLTYEFTTNGSQTGLLIRATEKSYAPPFINAGFVLDGSDRNDVRVGLLARLTLANLGGFGSELRTDLSFGEVYGISTEYMHPFGADQHFFGAARGYASRSPFDVYNGDARVAQYGITQAGAGVDLGYRFGRAAELRVGDDIVHLQGTLRIGQQVAPNASRTFGDGSIRFLYLGQDDVYLPTKGLIEQVRFDGLSSGSASGAYASAQDRTSYFVPLGKQGSVIVSASGGSTFGARQLGIQSFSLGGPFRLGGYGLNQFLGNQFWLGQGGYERKLFGLSPLIGEGVYGVGLVEVGKVYGNPRVTGAPYDGTVALVAKTAIGPLFVGGAAGGGHVKWWFGMGRIF